MKQITEDFVSFEIAKLLKEKGFDELCFALYNPEEELIQCGIRLSNTQVGRVHGSYSAPTHQMALKWLREVHKLHITILWDCGAYTGKNSFCYHIDRMDNYEDKGYNKIGFDSYEEAIEAACLYVLKNLI